MTPAQTEPYLHILATLELAHASNEQRYACTVSDPQQARGEAILHAHTQARILKSITHTRALLDATAQNPDPALASLVEAVEVVLAFSFGQTTENEGYAQALQNFVTLKRTLRQAVAPFRQGQEK